MDDPLVGAFLRLEQRSPRNPILLSATHRSTVADIAGLSREVEALLAGYSVPPGGAVGLAAPNGPGFLAGFLALRSLGHPVLLIDGTTPRAERQRVVDGLGAAAILAAERAWPRRASDFSLTLGHGSLRSEGLGGVAVIKLSSGSTGDARGVCVTSQALLADDRALVSSMGIREDDIFLATVPFSHSYGFSSLVLPALLRGARLALAGGSGPLGPLKTASETGATVFPSVPSYLAGLEKTSSVSKLPESLRLIVSAGAPLRRGPARRFRERFGQPVHVFYGASECGGITYDREGSAAERGTVGTPLDGVSVEIDTAVGAGEAEGSVVVRSPSVAATYWPTSSDRLSDGCFCTDDLGRWAGGELTLLGKANQVINVHGRKVQPREVERVIAQIDGVEDVAVTRGGDSHRDWVEAVVACRSGSVSAHEVVSFCRAQLAPFKIPRRVVLVEELPRNERGKLSRAELAELMSRRALEPAGREDQRG